MKKSNLVPVEERVCQFCSKTFQPKIGGYNAKYCSKYCGSRCNFLRTKEHKPQQLKAARSRSYRKTKASEERHKKSLATLNAYRENVRKWIIEYKVQRGCVDCGYNKHFSALQLDHEGFKSVSIVQARSSIARLMKEIEDGQCKVRCANCHAIVTWERKMKTKSNNPGEIGKGCGES